MAPKMPFLLFSVLFLAAGAYAQCGSAPPEQIGVRGRVIAPGADFDRYHEVLQLDESRLVAVGYTGATGEYKISPAQAPGYYYIVVRIDGFKEYRERVHIFGCDAAFDHFVFMEPEEEVIPPVILDFTGEVNEIVDVAELKKAFPAKVVAEFEHARQDRLRGERDRARTRLEKLVQEYPDFYDARNALGSVYLEMKRFRDAEAQYNKARELRRNSAAPLVSLGSLYVQEAEATITPEPGVAAVVMIAGDLNLILDDALDVLREAIKIKPDASFAYYLMGIAYIQGAGYVPAEVNLRKALEIEPRLRWARLALGNLYVRQGKWSEAMKEFDAYLSDYGKVSNRSEVQEIRNKIAAKLGGSP